MNNDNMEADVAAFAALLSKKSNKSYRRYRLEHTNGRLMIRRDEIDRLFAVGHDGPRRCAGTRRRQEQTATTRRLTLNTWE